MLKITVTMEKTMATMIVTIPLSLAGGWIAGRGLAQGDGAKIAIGGVLFAVALGISLIPV